MTVDYGIFCDECKEYVDLGEWLWNKDRFQRNKVLMDFMVDHKNKCCSTMGIHIFDDASVEYLDRLDYKETMIEKKRCCDCLHFYCDGHTFCTLDYHTVWEPLEESCDKWKTNMIVEAEQS